jgi:hypothetical protein
MILTLLTRERNDSRQRPVGDQLRDLFGAHAEELA